METIEKYNRDPRITLNEQKGEKLSFMIDGTDTSMVNGLRRVIISETPTVAIQLVNIHVNTSYLCDEYIAHRLAMIPLDCSKLRDFTEDDQVVYEINVRNDAPRTANRKTTVDVTTQDIKHISGPKLYPVHYGKDQTPVPLLTLGRGQHLHVECIAVKGIGKFHAKWNPTCECVFTTFAQIDINDEMVANKLSPAEREEFVSKCPRNVFDYSGVGEKITVKDADNCIFCDECLTYAGDNGLRGLVSVVPKTDKFLFRIESTGVYPPKIIVKKALEEMKKKFEFLREQLN